MASLQCSPAYKTLLRQLAGQHRRSLYSISTPVLARSFSSSPRNMFVFRKCLPRYDVYRCPFGVWPHKVDYVSM